MGKLSITIDKEWFEKNKEKLNERYLEKYSGTEQSEIDDNWHIEINDYNTIMEYHENDNEIEISPDWDDRNHDHISAWMNNEVTTSLTVGIVQATIDDLKGEAFAQIVEVIVKKFNKFRAALESLKGL